MKQVPFGQRSGFHVPRANIGAMRLPENTDEAVALIRHAIDAGMRYIDTCRGYGDSEIKVGKALKDGYRQKVILSTKWAPWVMKVEASDNASADCVRRRIEESMKRLDVDYLDYYQVWSVNSREYYDQAVARGGMVDGIKKAIAEKLVGHTGFTTHDTVENIIGYIKEADWCEIILFSCNILNLGYEPAIAAAHAKGIGTIIMNPLAGGVLAQPSPVLGALAERVGAKTVPELALRFLVSNPAIITVISGITRMSDVDNTMAAVDRGEFTPAQMDLIRDTLAKMHLEKKAFCTGCRYCMPCGEGIDIPAIMDMIAQYRVWGFRETARARYRNLKGPQADTCARCGKCEEKCTQHLRIMEEMSFAARHLAAE